MYIKEKLSKSSRIFSRERHQFVHTLGNYEKNNQEFFWLADIFTLEIENLITCHLISQDVLHTYSKTFSDNFPPTYHSHDINLYAEFMNEIQFYSRT